MQIPSYSMKNSQQQPKMSKQQTSSVCRIKNRISQTSISAHSNGIESDIVVRCNHILFDLIRFDIEIEASASDIPFFNACLIPQKLLKHCVRVHVAYMYMCLCFSIDFSGAVNPCKHNIWKSVVHEFVDFFFFFFFSLLSFFLLNSIFQQQQK